MGIVSNARKNNVFGADLGINIAWDYFNTSYQEYELESKLIELDDDHIGYCCDLVKPDEAYEAFSLEYVRVFNAHFGTNLVFNHHINDIQGWGFTRSEFSFTDEDIKALEKYIEDNDLGHNLIEQIKESTTYRSGFIPFITDEDILKADDSYFEVLINALMNSSQLDMIDTLNFNNTLSEWFYSTDLTEMVFVENDR